MKYVNVVVENKTRHTDTFFTYKCSDHIKVGDVLRVPFNKGNKEMRGFVFSEIKEDEISFDKSRIKEALGKDPDLSLTEEIMSTSLWMKQRYGVKYIDAINCFIPKGKKPKEGKEKRPLMEAKEEILQIDKLTEEQEKALGEINKALEDRKQKNFLIHGVTGSGKTEIYMQTIEKTLSLGRTAIMLVPEIALTKQITERFLGRFGRERVAILHSKLTLRERFDEWTRIRNGEADIVIGARMAVFAPLENIGLIIMDEEHEQTYKSDQNPKYETVDVALKRLMYFNGVLVLGSATPSVVTYQRGKEGIFKVLKLKERYNGTELPDIDIVDMREELKSGNRGMFSHRLKEEIRNSLDLGEQAILFLNRRGYSNFISCRECGEPIICNDCGISMTYHKERNALVCHYCGRTMPAPKLCPTCGSKYIKHFGIGTEQVEEYTKESFPTAKVARLDLDTAKNNREINKIINSFAKGETDILIGTQLVAKGLDFKNVGLVGVIAADSGLNIPDYRSGERTFQLITQVSGRAGRGDKKGKVIVQTYSPESIAIENAASYDYEGYFEKEIRFRDMMGYPPFSDLILVEFTDKNERIAEESAEDFYKYIKGPALVDEGDEIFSPRVSKHFKGRGGDSYRFHVLIKCRRNKELEKKKISKRSTYLARINSYIEKMIQRKSSCAVVVDVNPYSTI